MTKSKKASPDSGDESNVTDKGNVTEKGNVTGENKEAPVFLRKTGLGERKTTDDTSKPEVESETTPPSPDEVLPPPPEEVMNWVRKMSHVPLANVKGAGSTQENRCNPSEVQAVVNAVTSVYGIEEPTALIAITEMIRRGGANASTPESFCVDVKCETQNVVASVSKRDVATLVSRHANSKTMRNLAEGMAEAVVIHFVGLVRRNPGLDRPGDLAKKVDNRLFYEKKPLLTPTERVGCASYAQWLPHLDQLVGSNRLKNLLAQDLELRKSGRVKPQPTAKGEGNKSARRPATPGAGPGPPVRASSPCGCAARPTSKNKGENKGKNKGENQSKMPKGRKKIFPKGKFSREGEPKTREGGRK